MREDVSGERRAVEGSGAADIPIQPDTCTVTYILHGNSRGGRGDKGARKQENPHRVGVALTIENECARQISRPGGNRIGAREDRASEVRA